MGPRRSSASCVSTGYSLGRQGATSKNMAGPKDATNMPESGQSYGGKLLDQSLTYSRHVAFPWIREDDGRCVLVLPGPKVPRLTPYLMQTSWLYFPSASEPSRQGLILWHKLKHKLLCADIKQRCLRPKMAPARRPKMMGCGKPPTLGVLHLGTSS